MTQQETLNHLKQLFALLEKATAWLRRSYDICQKIGTKSVYTPEELDAYETLTSRFARVSDLIIQKIFRSIDIVELEDGGSLIDAVNRAHKRGLIQSVDDIREIRDIRNHIAHEYADEEIYQTFEEVLFWTPNLFQLTDAIREYLKKRIPDFSLKSLNKSEPE